MVRSGQIGVLLFALCAPAPAALAADAFSSDWAQGLKSSARLIGGGASGGTIRVGVEIKLAPGAITYWRNPGDAGLPPTLSFEGSDNLARANALFPAPKRLAEGDGEAFGYDGSVILPVDVEALAPAKPVTLALKLNYAVCEKICVPAEAKLRLVLPPDATGASPFAEAIGKARDATPRPVAWNSLGGDLTADGDNAWRLCVASQSGPKRDLFLEAPDAWWLEVKPDASGAAGKDCFHIALMQKPADAKLPVAARLTLTGGAAPVETEITLGAGAKL
jgi:DsbC/DsbD-like thiol-disulfide interchange protein